MGLGWARRASLRKLHLRDEGYIGARTENEVTWSQANSQRQSALRELESCDISGNEKRQPICANRKRKAKRPPER